MTTRTLLITVPGSGDSEACGDCPFLGCDTSKGSNDYYCTMGLDGWWDGMRFGPEARRHAACLDAERDAPGVSERKRLMEAQAFRAEINRSADRSRLREVHEHLTAHGLPALDRLDAEDVP